MTSYSSECKHDDMRTSDMKDVLAYCSACQKFVPLDTFKGQALGKILARIKEVLNAKVH